MPLTFHPDDDDINTTVKFIKGHRREPEVSRSSVLVILGSTLMLLSGISSLWISVVR